MDKEAGSRPKKKTNILLRILCFLLGVVLVLGAVGLIVFRDQINLDSIRRWFSYRTLTLSDSGQAVSFRYNGTVNDVFVDVNGDLLVCTGNAISLYSGSGTQYIDQSVKMNAPAADVQGSSAVVYDAGGSELYVIKQRELVFTLESSGTLLSAHLNGAGQLVVVSQESGFRGVVTVYDTAYAPQTALRLSSSYVMDADLSDDGRTLAVVTIGQTGGTFASTLSLYDLSGTPGEEISYDVLPTATCSLGSSVILTLSLDSAQRLWALGDQGLSVLDSSASILGVVDWSDRYLKTYSLAGDGFAVALLGKYRAGSQAELMVVDSEGVLTGSLEWNEQVLSVDASGRYFAVLTADRLDIYTQDMTLYSSLEGTQNARKVLLREDGSAILIASETARLYVPS